MSASWKSLTEFLALAEADGALIRITSPIPPGPELTAIATQISRDSEAPPAILFERVGKSQFPVACNLVADHTRLCRALRVGTLPELQERLSRILQPELPAGTLERLRLIPRFGELLNLPAEEIFSAASQQVVLPGSDVDLHSLPFIRFWPNDAGPSFSSTLVITSDPETDCPVFGQYAIEQTGPRAAAIHYHETDPLAACIEAARHRGSALAVAMIPGCDPLLEFVARLPLPPETDPWLLAGFLRAQPWQTIRARTHQLQVPADAECVIEGLIDPQSAPQTTGPLGHNAGFYSLERSRLPVDVTAVTHRAAPVFNVCVPRPWPHEACWIDRAVDQLCVPLARLIAPEIRDLRCPRGSGPFQTVLVRMRKRYAHHGRQIAQTIWSLRPYRFAKTVIVVDEEIDLSDSEAVMNRLLTCVDPARDVVYSEGIPHPLDHLTASGQLATRLAIDATLKDRQEFRGQVWPAGLSLPSFLIEQIRPLLPAQFSEADS